MEWCGTFLLNNIRKNRLDQLARIRDKNHQRNLQKIG